MDTLEKLQSIMYRSLLSCPKSTPRGAMLADMGGKLIKYRIQERKLNFIHHLINLPDGSLAGDILRVQVQLGLPGLGSDVREILRDLQLPDIFRLQNISKAAWKNIVREAIKKRNSEDISDMLKISSKLKGPEIACEPIQRKP